MAAYRRNAFQNYVQNFSRLHFLHLVLPFASSSFERTRILISIKLYSKPYKKPKRQHFQKFVTQRSHKKLEDDDDEDEEVIHISKLDVQFVSLKTFYYMVYFQRPIFLEKICSTTFSKANDLY